MIYQRATKRRRKRCAVSWSYLSRTKGFPKPRVVGTECPVFIITCSETPRKRRVRHLGWRGFPANGTNAGWCGKTCISMNVILSLGKAGLAQLNCPSLLPGYWAADRVGLAGIRGAEGSWSFLPAHHAPTPSTHLQHQAHSGLWQ